MDYSYPFIPVHEKKKKKRNKHAVLLVFSLIVVSVGSLFLANIFSLRSASNPIMSQLQSSFTKMFVPRMSQADKIVLAAVATPVPTLQPPIATPTPVPTFTLNGVVYVDTNLNKVQDASETGYAGVMVTVLGLSPASTTTDANGNYSLSGLRLGTYNVTATIPNGYKATTTNPVSMGLASNQNLNFGIARTHTVSGRIFLDNNRNSTYDSGDGGYSGGTVTFAGPQNTTVRTNADGTYTAALFAGIYTVTTSLPASYLPSTPMSITSTVNANQTFDFGAIPRFTIAGTLFEDKNEDGRQNSGDSVASGITVTLSGATSSSTITNANGDFSFPNLYAGIYTVTYTLPPKKKSTSATSQTITFTAPVTANSGSSAGRSDIDFGVITQYDIQGRVFVDRNSNGLFEVGEQSYPGATISLTKGNSSIASTSASNGNYLFALRPSGDYTIAMDIPTGYRSTTVNSLNMVVNTDQTINFGIVQSTITSVGGICTGDTLDVVMIFDHSNSMNDPDPSTGRPKMEVARPAAMGFVDVVAQNLPNARIGVVQFAGSHDYPNSTTQTSVVAPLSNNFAQARNAINNIQPGQSGSGTCYDCAIAMTNTLLRNTGRPGVQKMVVFMTDGIATTRIGLDGDIQEDTTGVRTNENAAMQVVQQGVNELNIIYNVIGFGSGTEINEPFMNQLADTNYGIYLNSPRAGTIAQIYQRIADTTIGTGRLSGRLFHDRNTNKTYDTDDSPLVNWTVNARTPGIATPATATTDASGNYTLTALCTRNYTVTQVLQPGWYQTTDTNAYTVNVVSGNTYNNNDFGNASGFSISGNIVNDLDKNLTYASPDTLFGNDVTVLFNGPIQRAVSTLDGKYTSGAMPPGTYTVSLISPLTSGYRMTYPLTGPPPSFQVTIGTNCNVQSAGGGAICR